MNETGSLVKKVSIRLPEVRGDIISIAKGPEGEIYIFGNVGSDSMTVIHFNTRVWVCLM